MLRSKSTDPPTNRELINKIDNDITLLRGEVMRLTELVKILADVKRSSLWAKKEGDLKSKSQEHPPYWLFS